MSFWYALWCKYFKKSRLVGQDSALNEYYVTASGKRFVIYAKGANWMMLPPVWRAWLIGQMDEPLHGEGVSYMPIIPDALCYEKKRFLAPKDTPHYTPWDPKHAA